mmetsp:Transcript_19587/g.59259  ORF Transcript_19587/g.59259 Transcript_19587/m.59259 type:complete len:241 (+) Transcript_19587:880-1602(+)
MDVEEGAVNATNGKLPEPTPSVADAPAAAEVPAGTDGDKSADNVSAPSPPSADGKGAEAAAHASTGSAAATNKGSEEGTVADATGKGATEKESSKEDNKEDGSKDKGSEKEGGKDDKDKDNEKDADKEKKREKEKPKKHYRVDDRLLAACRYFDHTGAGYIRADDLRRLLHVLDRDLPHWLIREAASMLASESGRSRHSKIAFRDIYSEEVLAPTTTAAPASTPDKAGGDKDSTAAAAGK